MIDFPAPARRRRARTVVAALFLVTVAIWAYAGYAIGETRGRGWRDAAIRDGCKLHCPPGSVFGPPVVPAPPAKGTL